MTPGSSVKVRGFGGVACRYLGPVKVWEPWTYLVSDPETGTELEVPDETEGEWVDGDGSRVRIHMVGDDTVYEVDVTDLTAIGEEEFCPECGQLGCAWR